MSDNRSAAILERIEQHLKESPIKLARADTPIKRLEGTKTIWEFSSNLKELAERDEKPAANPDELATKKKNTDHVNFFRPLVRETIPFLEREYNIHCTHVAHDFAHKIKNFTGQPLSGEEKARFTAQLAAALAMSELLVHIYFYYLDMSDEIKQLQDEQDCYRQILRDECDFIFPETKKFEVEPYLTVLSHHIGTGYFRDKTANLNWLRLFTIRIRRALMMLLPLIPTWGKFNKFINFLDQFAAPFLNYVAWLFYIPRLATSLFVLFKHLFPNEWTGMGEKEDQLEQIYRLEAQLQRRWFFLGNDAAWFIAGVLGCFILTGTLAPVGMYVSVSVFFFDVIMASSRAFIEIRWIMELQQKYDTIAENRRAAGATDAELVEIEDFQKHLDHRLDCETQRLVLAVMSTSALFLAMCLAIPAIAAINPIIPFIGAILILTITLVTFLVNREIDKHAPLNKAKDNLETIKKGQFLFKNPYAMFQPADTIKTVKIGSDLVLLPVPDDNELLLSQMSYR